MTGQPLLLQYFTSHPASWVKDLEHCTLPEGRRVVLGEEWNHTLRRHKTLVGGECAGAVTDARGWRRLGDAGGVEVDERRQETCQLRLITESLDASPDPPLPASFCLNSSTTFWIKILCFNCVLLARFSIFIKWIMESLHRCLMCNWYNWSRLWSVVFHIQPNECFLHQNVALSPRAADFLVDLLHLTEKT